MSCRPEEIPTEIWLAIADTIHENDHSEARNSKYGAAAAFTQHWTTPTWAQNIIVSSSRLAALSSTCRRLRHILAPLYFKTLTLKPNDVFDHYAIFLRLVQKVMRPEFEHLRGFVNELSLKVMDDSTLQGQSDISSSISALLFALPRLESLRLHSVSLDNTLLRTLFALPLKSLHVQWCTVVSFEPVGRWPTRTVSSRLQRFFFFDCYGYLENVATWIRAMLVPSLAEAYILALDHHIELAQLPLLRRLKVCGIDRNNLATERFIPIDFLAASNLEEVYFDGPGSSLIRYVPLNHLKRVACFPAEASWLITRRPVTEAEIYSSHFIDDTQDWKDTLAALTSGSVSLTALKMTQLRGVPGEVITAGLAAKLPMLVHLELPTHGVNVIRAMVPELARFEHLERLSFGFKTERGVDLEDQKDIITLLTQQTKSKALSEISFGLRLSVPWYRNGSEWKMVYPSEPTITYSLEVPNLKRTNGEENEV